MRDFLKILELSNGASFLKSDPIIKQPSESSIPEKVVLNNHLSLEPEIFVPSCLQSIFLQLRLFEGQV